MSGVTTKYLPRPRRLQLPQRHNKRLISRDKDFLHRSAHHANFDLIQAQVSRRFHIWLDVEQRLGQVFADEPLTSVIVDV